MQVDGGTGTNRRFDVGGGGAAAERELPGGGKQDRDATESLVASVLK